MRLRSSVLATVGPFVLFTALLPLEAHAGTISYSLIGSVNEQTVNAGVSLDTTEKPASSS